MPDRHGLLNRVRFAKHGAVKAGLCGKPKLSNVVKLIWPSRSDVKIFLLLFPKFSITFVPSRLIEEGRCANVTTRWGAGSDGRDVAQRAQGMPTYAMLRTVKSQGPGLPTLRSAQRVKRVVATVANKPGRRGDCV